MNIQNARLVASVSFMIFFFLVFYFLYHRIESSHKLSEEMSIKWLEEANRRDETENFAKAIKIAEPEIAKLESHFADNSDLVPFLNTIEGIAPKAGVEAETTDVDISQDKKNLILGLKARGSFDAVYKFITLIENSSYEMEFIYLDIFRSSGQGDVSGPMWEATMRLKLITFTI